MLPGICESLGLPYSEGMGSKRERMTASFVALTDAGLPRVAANVLKLHPPYPSDRNANQDLPRMDPFRRGGPVEDV
jgi:hypothetical protein